MKHLLISILLFSTIGIQAQEINFIGKWVPIKTEFYTEDNLEETEEKNLNKECIEYIEFLTGGKTRTKEYYSDCEAKDATLGTYEFKDGLWKLSADGESYLAKLRIKNDELQMIVKFPDEDGKRKEVIVHFVNYDSLIQKTAQLENTNLSYCDKMQEEQTIMYQNRIEQGTISSIKSTEILTLLKLFCENASKEEFQKLLKPVSEEDFESISISVKNKMQSYTTSDVNYVIQELRKTCLRAEEEKHQKLELLYDIDKYLEEIGVK